MKEEVIIFTNTNPQKLSEDVNQWFVTKGDTINVIDRKFTKDWLGREKDFSIAIFYKTAK